MIKITTSDEIAIFFGAFSHAKVIVLIFLIGILVKELKLNFVRRYFLEAIMVLLFSIIFNLALKYSFAIPLPEERFGKDAFAFPSGHMHSAIAFYGWLALRYKSRMLYALVAVLWIGIIFGMLHFQYHEMRDIYGAFFFGSILLACYSYILKNHYSKVSYIVHICTAFLMIYIYFIHEGVIIPITWLAFVGANIMIILMKKLYPKLQ